MSEQPITSPSSTHLDRYRTAEGGWVKDAPLWTVAYRKPRANRFLRVELALTWHAARDLARQLAEDTGGLEIYYTTSADAELAGYGHAEDHANILVDSGRRVRILEGGTLPAATAAWLATQAQIARAWDDAHRENEDRDGIVRPVHHLRRGYQTHVSCGVTDFYYADTHEWASKVTCEACKAADDQEYMDRAHADALEEDDERRVQAWHQRMVDRDHAEALNEDAARTVACSSIFAIVRMIGECVPTSEAREAMQALRDEDHDRARAEDTHRFGRAVGAAGFRRCVRSIWVDRARGFNDPVTYRRFRESMSFYARAVRLHDRRIRAI